MIVEVRAKNCFVFDNEISFSMKADMRNKKFITNVYRENNFNVLKVAGIYGPNNAGKTCLIKCIKGIRNILLNDDFKLESNIFSENTVCEMGITFLEQGRKFSYDFKYDTNAKEYIYEKFSEIIKDQYGNEKEEVWLEKDISSNTFKYENTELMNMMPLISSNSLIVYLVDIKRFPKLEAMKQILVSFASKIDIIDMNNIPIQNTINLMKNKNAMQQKVVNFIKDADLDMEDFEYADMDKIKIELNDGEIKPAEKALDIPENLIDQIRLVSVYKGVHVPSILFDSTGTKKIAALASYIVEGLEEGRILVIDELDSSIHFKLTRAIVAMFNNELNTNAQMIFTVHDINLMDCKKLFRKEQIWFVHKDKEGVYVYSLADFTAEEGVRDTTDVIEKYRKGILGALPYPEFINTLINLKGYSKERDID